MEDRGLKIVCAVQTAMYFIIALVWSVSEDAPDIVPLIILMWLCFVLCVLKVLFLFMPALKFHSSVVVGLAFAAVMALSGAIVVLFCVYLGFDGEQFSDAASSITVFALIILLAVAEACAFVCGIKRDKK